MKEAPFAPSTKRFYFVDYEKQYERILQQARSTILGWPPKLQYQAQRSFSHILNADFARVVALLPYWVSQTVETPASVLESLGLANLWGWWYYRRQDRMLDGHKEQSHQAKGHQEILEEVPEGIVFFNECIHLLQFVVPNDSLFWSIFRDTIVQASEANAQEVAYRFTDFSAINSHMLETNPPEMLAERAAPLRLSTAAQLRRAGYFPGEPLYRDLMRIIEAYSIVSRLLDDEEDICQDLGVGQLTSVSAATIQRMLDKGVICEPAELDVNRVVGYYITDDSLLNEFHQIKRHYLDLGISLAQNWQLDAVSHFLQDIKISVESEYKRESQQRRAFRDLFRP
jgi:hypothetical protein